MKEELELHICVYYLLSQRCIFIFIIVFTFYMKKKKKEDS